MITFEIEAFESISFASGQYKAEHLFLRIPLIIFGFTRIQVEHRAPDIAGLTLDITEPANDPFGFIILHPARRAQVVKSLEIVAVKAGYQRILQALRVGLAKKVITLGQEHNGH